MKKLYIILTMAVFAQAGWAQQFSQGTILAGGGVSLSNNKTETYNGPGIDPDENITQQFNFNVFGGYFVADNLAVGLRASITSQKFLNVNVATSTISNSSETRMGGTQLSLFARYYKTIGQSRFAIFGQADAGYGFGKISYENKNVNGGTTVTVDSESKQTSLNFGVSPGITFFVTDRLALEATAGRIGYSITNTVAYDSAGDKAGESKNSALSLAVNPNSFSFGLTFFIGGGSSAGTATN